MSKEGESFNHQEMVLRGRLGGLAKSARHDSVEGTQKARDAFLGRFEKEVEKDNQLSDEERLRRARAALKLHMNQLARRSAEKRKK